jgi:hypothetical protein
MYILHTIVSVTPLLQVFLWLQRTMVNFDDDAEGDFLMLGRKLLTVGRHVVSDANSETALSAEFWHQAASIQRETKVCAYTQLSTCM